MKKIIAILLSMLMVLSSISVFAAVSAPDLSGEALYTADAEKTITSTTQDFFKYDATWVNSSNDLVLSFDVKLSQADKNIHISLRSEVKDDTSKYNNYVTAAVMTFKDNGKFALYDKTTDYQADKWYNITGVMHPAGADTTIKWYLDNQHLTTADLNGVANKENIAGPAYAIVYEPASGAAITVKNFKAANGLAFNKAYATSAVLNGNMVQVEFNEPVDKATLTSVDVISPDGVSVKGADYTLLGRKLTIPVANAKTAGEYTVVLNEGVKSVSGKVLGNDSVAFEVAAGKAAPDFDTAAVLIDWNKKTADTAAADDGSLGTRNYNSAAAGTYVKVDDAHGTSLKISDTDKDPMYGLRSLKKDFWNGWSNYAFDMNNEMIIEFDFYADANQKRTPLIAAYNGGWNNSPSIGFFLDSYGHFVAIGDSAASYDNAMTYDDLESGNYTSKGYEAYTLKATSDNWHHLSIVWNTQNDSIDYFVDGELAIEGKNYKDADVFEDLRFRPADSASGSTKGAWIIDNLQVNFRYTGDRVLGKVVENNTDAAINIAKTQYGSAAVVKSVDAAYAEDTDYMLRTEIQLTEKPENGEMNFYIMNKDGQRLHSGMFYGDDKFGLYWHKDAGVVYPSYASSVIYPAPGAGSSFYAPINMFDTDSDKTVTLDAYFDAADNKMFVYANGTLIGEQNFSKDMFAGYTDCVPARISIAELRTDNGDGTTTSLLADGEAIIGKIGDMTLYQICDAKIDKAYVNTSDDVYSVYSKGINTDVKSIDLYCETAIASADVTLTSSKGNDVPVTVGAYDAVNKKISVTVTNGFLPAGVYSLNVSNITATDESKTIAPFSTGFEVNGSDKAVVTKFEIKTDGDTKYIDGAAENLSADTQYVTFILAEYSGSGTILEDVDFVKLPLASGVTISIDNTTESKVVLTPAAGNTVSAFVWDSFENANPYLEKLSEN